MAKRRGRISEQNQVGRMVLPEDRIRNGMMDGPSYRRTRMREKAPRASAIPRAPVSTEDVERRVMRAMKTLRALPDKEARFHRVQSQWPSHVQEAMDAYGSVEAAIPRFNPTPFDVTDCLHALTWVRHLEKNDWKILWWRSFELSFGTIAMYIGRSDETARRRYRDIMIDVWTAANGLAT